ncbi:MAG: citramalate synthase, partial [Oscillospiraceae bacterium]
MKKLSIFDSTLRDGAQSTGISFSLEDKLAIIKLLDRIGVDYIEAGNPYSNPKDSELYRRAASLSLQHSRLCAFGSTMHKDSCPERDSNLQALALADTGTCVIFGKCWLFHVENVLETTPEENLRMIRESCRFLKDRGKEVVFDGEHFFDGFKEHSEYALKALEAAAEGGADMLCLCDTNGGAFPNEVEKIVRQVKKHFSLPLSVHFHDDCGMATANSLMGVL